MRRRELSFMFGGLVAAGPLSSQAQRPNRPVRIGVLARAPFSDLVFPKQFPPALAERGYREGIDVTIDWLSAESDAEALPNLAKGLVATGVDLIITVTNSEAVAARAATRTIPIVMLAAINPVETGLIDSLARPGGNITGSAWLASETAGKALQVLQEAVPQTRRVGVFLSADAPEQKIYADAMGTVASGTRRDLRAGGSGPRRR